MERAPKIDDIVLEPSSEQDQMQDDSQAWTEEQTSQSVTPDTMPLPEIVGEEKVPAPTFPQRRPKALIAVLVSMIVLFSAALLLPLFTPAQLAPPVAQKTTPLSVGVVAFSSSGQLDPKSSSGLNDIITVDLQHLGNPGRGKSLYAWLLSETNDQRIKPVLLGKGTPNGGRWHLFYQSPDHANLLASRSIFLVTEEVNSSHPAAPTQDKAAWRYQGSIPNIPTPGDEEHFSQLSHLRHLIASDPTLQAIGLGGGLEIWLYRNSQKVLEYTTAARDGWASGTSGVDLLRRQVIRTLQYLDGINYSRADTGLVPWLIDQKAGRIGLLDFFPNQNPPGYLPHIILHLDGFINAPGSTVAQRQFAARVDDVMKKMTRLYQAIKVDAAKLVKMSNQQILQNEGLTLLNDMAKSASAAYAGQFGVTGELQPGLTWLHGQFQALATMEVATI